jgi:ABC-type oligopeptide transport system substrate-binding subunit
VDFRTLRIELEKKNPYFLTILMHPCWSPLNETVVKSFDQHHKNINVSSAFKTKIISNGPFVLAERMPGAALLFTKNDQYWDADNVLLTSVTFSFSRDQVTETRHFYERTVDIIETLLDSENIVSNLNRDELMVSPSFSCFGLAFNTTTPPFGDKNVRRALSIAIDREKLLDKIDKNRRLAAYGFISKNGRRRHERLFQRDAELAKQLLLEAGYGNNFPKIEVLCSTSELELNTAAIEQVIKDWKTILGIDSRVNCRDLGSFFEHRKRLNFDIIKVSFEVKHCDPMSLLNVFASDNPENHGKWHDKQYDEIIDKLGRAVDEDDYEALVEAAELRLADEMPVIPLFFGSKSYLVNKAIKGWFANEMNMHPLKFVYCEGE